MFTISSCGGRDSSCSCLCELHPWEPHRQSRRDADATNHLLLSWASEVTGLLKRNRSSAEDALKQEGYQNQMFRVDLYSAGFDFYERLV